MKTKYLKIFTLCGLLSGLTIAAVACGGDEPTSPVNPNPNPDPNPGGGTTTPTEYFTAKVGETLPAWTEGTLDIHSISTGRGESYLFILPDGTTLLVDAAGSLLTKKVCETNGIAELPLEYRPSGNISSGTVIADYVTHFNPHGKTVDYWMNSHFDTDHMGNFPETYAQICPVSAAVKKHPEGGFYLNGINEVGTLLDFKKIIDRGYTTPIDRSGEARMKDYIKFLEWTKKTKGTVYEPANVGHNDQVVMNYNPSKYSGDLDIRILCAGGWYWTGSGQNKKCNLPVDSKGNPDQAAIKAASPKENIYSVGFMLKFGKFDYFTAGDLQYNSRSTTPWLDSEAPLIPVVKQVEMMKACHHGTANTNSPELLRVLAPKQILVSPWRDVQPRPETLGRFTAVSPNASIFTTGIDSDNKNKLSNYFSNVKSWEGHIVVRVAPTGEYKIFILDDKNQDYKVKAIHGTYKSL